MVSKFLRKIGHDKRGTALLVAMLVMGVFIAISLALSNLVLRELKITKELIDAGKAYYAAESGIEESLYYLDRELPGWHADDQQVELDSGIRYNYTVKNTCNSHPCFDPEEFDTDQIVGSALYKMYDVLDLNQNITIPLFIVNEAGVVTPVKDFTVQFFGEFNPATDLRVKDVSGWDVLRWKLFGMRQNDAGEYVTESINDFTAISSGHTLDEGGDISATAKYPSWFGTVSCGVGSGQVIECVQYAPTESSLSGDGQICGNTEARDYYFYEQGEVTSVKDCYPIKDFLLRHQTGSDGATGLNYLSLTNLMNPSAFNSELEKFSTSLKRQERSKIYFRVETYGDELVRDQADITSTGRSGKNTQTINVKMKQGSYIPVFNFSVYSTYCGKAGGCELE